jgi:sulfotransferase family protein
MSDGTPILVTGAHRSGTTWVGKMLALAPGVAYIHEPFNPGTPAGISSAPFDRGFSVVTAENEARYLPGLRRTLAFDYALGAEFRSMRTPRDLARSVRDSWSFELSRRARRRPLVKDPIALLSAEWLAQRFGMEVVVLVRHPAGFAASLDRLGWQHDFATFVEDGRVPGILHAYKDEIRAQAEEPGDVLEQAALLWRILYGVAAGYRERHPDWIFLRHEDAGADPAGTFEQLYKRLGLELTPAARERIARASGSENPAEGPSPHAVDLDSAGAVSRWRDQLTPEAIARLRESTRDVWPSFYSGEDW